MNLLLAEDDALLADALSAQLRRAGFEVEHAPNGAVAEYLLVRQTFDAAILDIGLPMLDGLTVLSRVRVARPTLPVLLLTARDELSDRVEGLDAGADDYLAKPFDIPELLARLRALQRRAAGRIDQRLALGGLELDVAGRELRFAGARVALSPRELALTELLMQKAGRVVTKESIVARLSSWEADFSENSVEVYVHRLRKRFGELGVVIKTIRGFGYVMEAVDGPAGTAP